MRRATRTSGAGVRGSHAAAEIHRTDPSTLDVWLETPPLPCIVPAGVFDAYGWCPSARLEWRRPAQAHASRSFDAPEVVDGTNPAGMVFVFRRDVGFLPRELACFHVTGYGLTDEWALAPYAIDDATDGLFEQRLPPSEVFWLAADSLNGLFWGLHDWAHFHHHGSFEARAWTELQCDACALAWLWQNRVSIGITEGRWREKREEVAPVAERRFVEEGRTPDEARRFASPLEAEALVAWASEHVVRA